MAATAAYTLGDAVKPFRTTADAHVIPAFTHAFLVSWRNLRRPIVIGCSPIYWRRQCKTFHGQSLFFWLFRRMNVASPCLYCPEPNGTFHGRADFRVASAVSAV